MCSYPIVRFSFALLVALMAVVFAVACIAGGMPEPERITGSVWMWQKTIYNNGQEAVPAEPNRYTIEFLPDGKVHVQADCNQVGGTYTLHDSRLDIELTHSTRAMCPPDSLDQVFKKDLGAAATCFFKGDFLYLDLTYDSGTMRLIR